MTALELWQAFRNPAATIDEFNQLRAEYLRRFNTHVVVPAKLDYPMELMYELGFWAGNPLPVPIDCMSSYHNPRIQSPDTLPYAFKDGTKRMVCPHCEQAEHNEYFQKYPTEI